MFLHLLWLQWWLDYRYTHFWADYQQERIITFIAPDPNERYGNNYNVDQAIIAIGSGGLFGEGYGHGTQVQLRVFKGPVERFHFFGNF